MSDIRLLLPLELLPFDDVLLGCDDGDLLCDDKPLCDEVTLGCDDVTDDATEPVSSSCGMLLSELRDLMDELPEDEGLRTFL